MFGTRHIGMLFGVVFLSHQIGAFVGALLGGSVYETTGSYDAMWVLCIVLSVAAALVHLPIRERARAGRAGRRHDAPARRGTSCSASCLTGVTLLGVLYQVNEATASGGGRAARCPGCICPLH